VFSGQASSNATFDENLHTRLLPYRYALSTFRPNFNVYQASNISSNSSNSSNSNNTNSSVVTTKTMFVKVEIFVLDRPIDYADPLAVSEAYEIFINADGDATLRCAGYVSFLRALQTLSQLVQRDGTIQRLPIYISDFPSYQWRAVMLDVVSNYQTIPEIKRLVRGMRVSKLNVLQLHLTDAQAFPLELQVFPELTASAAYSKDKTYSRLDIADLIQYAQLYGVVVVPEMQTPVHTASWTRAEDLSKLNTCGHINPLKWADYCSYPPCGQLDPTNEKTYFLTGTILGELESLFPSRYLHYGGDAYNSACWDLSDNIAKFMKETNLTTYDDLYDYYVNVINLVTDVDRTVIYNDIQQLRNLTYFQNGILQYWLPSAGLDDLLEFQNPLILGQLDELYLTCGELIGPKHNNSQNACGQSKTWWTVYNFTIPAA
jgi:hexosaminidase